MERFKISLGEWSEIEIGKKEPKETRVRFSLTFHMEDPDGAVSPCLTMRGWTIDKFRVVRTPGTMPRFGKSAMSFNIAAPWFLELVASKCNGMPGVESVLGPRQVKDRKKARMRVLDIDEVVVAE